MKTITKKVAAFSLALVMVFAFFHIGTASNVEGTPGGVYEDDLEVEVEAMSAVVDNSAARQEALNNLISVLDSNEFVLSYSVDANGNVDVEWDVVALSELSFDDLATALAAINSALDAFKAVRALGGGGGVLYGDVNGDGQVTGVDATLLRRYVAGWDNLTPEIGRGDIDLAAADVNADGSVTGVDATILRRHVAGWSDFAKLPHIVVS